MRARGAVRLVAWVSFLLASLCFLAGAGDGALGGPPLLHPGSLEVWLRRSMENGPSAAVGAGFAALRLLAVALCGYLLLLTVASLLAHAAGWSRAARFADRRGPWVVSVMVRSSLGLTLSTAGLVASAPVSRATSIVVAVSGPAHRGPEHGLEQRKGGVLASGGTTATTNDAPMLEWVGPPANSTRARSRRWAVPRGSTTGSPPRRSPSAATAPPTGPTLPAAVVPATWTVRPGDSFWSIATAILQTAWDRSPTDTEVDPYWLALIAANRQALLHPDLPDLIYPGQELVVPVPPAPGGG